MLLDYSRQVPALPERLAGALDAMERVEECQTPFFVAVELGEGERVSLHFDAPAESPTARGFAGILSEGLDGAPRPRSWPCPGFSPPRLQLNESVSPLRLRGMGAILGRLKRLVGVQVEARAAGTTPSQ